MAIESRIDIIVKNLNKLNDVSKSLQQIQKSNEELVKGLNRLEKKLNSVEKQGSGVFSSMSQDASVAAKNVGKVSRAFDRFNLFGGKGLGGKAGGGGGILSGMLGGLGGAGAVASMGYKNQTDALLGLGNGISSIVDKIPIAGNAMSNFTSNLAQSVVPTTAFEKALYGVGDQLMAHPQWYGAAAVALMALAGPLKSVAVSGLGKLGNALKQNKKDLNTFKAATVEAARGMDVLVRGASLRELNQYVSAAKKEMESFWHMTGRAETAAGELAIALRKQGLEQRAINDLLLKAQGKATSFEQYQNKQALGEQKAASLEADKVWRARAKEYEIAQKLEVARKKELQDMGRIGARARKRAATRRKEINSRFRENLMLGAGFPMLFGGGLGSIAGGVGGAIAQKGGKGFGAQIFFSALGQQFDSLVSSMVASTAKLGKAFSDIKPDIATLVSALGETDTAYGQHISVLEQIKGKESAFEEVRKRMINLVGAKGVKALREFGDQVTELASEFSKAMTQMRSSFAKWLNRTGIGRGITGQLEKANLQRQATYSMEDGTASSEMVQLQEQLEKYSKPRWQGGDLAKWNETIDKIVDLQRKINEGDPLLNKGALKAQELQKEIDLLERSLQVGTKRAGIEREVAEYYKAQGKDVENIDKKEKEAVITQLEKRDRLQEQLEVWEQIKNTIASGLTNAITGLIEGTKTLGQSLADIAKQIANLILQKAILSAVDKAFTFGSGGVTTGETTPVNKFATGRRITNYATGGMATKPTIALVAEAGENEYVIPASKMASSMQRYSAGARGEAVIPGTGSSHAGGGAGGSTTVNYSGPILNFNSEEFVPKSAVGQIIATATSRGAKAGEARTLSSLQNSRSRRSNLGL